MSDQVAVESLLAAPLNFEQRTAITYINAKGRCEYCDRDLIHDRLGYACAQIDHLLPQGKFPYEITGRQNNFVLSCALCNGVKRDSVVLEEGEEAFAMLATNRSQLILRAREIIEKGLEEANLKWVHVKNIFSELASSSAH
jgi:hypothetical protein